MFSFLYRKKEENTIKILWEKILTNIKDKSDISNLSDDFHSFIKLIKEETKKINSENITYIKDNNILNQLTNLILNNPELRPILLEYLSSLLNQLKYLTYIFENNDDLFISLQNLVINLKKEFEQKSYKFLLKNEFANLLNSLTRILLTYPSMLSYFIIKSQKFYLNIEYDDFIIFSSLLKLLQLDQMINNYNIKKNIRRSLIVFLSFDDINKNDYLLNDSFIVEILVDKLCSYYQMLPSFFDINQNAKSLEPYANLDYNCFRSIYFDYKDYITFLDKIISCFINIKIKMRFQNYFFNKFLIENVLTNILSHNLKIFRTHLQYLTTLLKSSKNSKIIVDILSYFLLGLNELNENIDNKNNNSNEESNNNNNEENNSQINNEETSEETSDNIPYIYQMVEYDPNKIRKKLLKNMCKTKEYINIIIYDLFNIFFKEKPFITMKNFVKPYIDLVINKANNKTKYILGNMLSYPLSNQLISLLEKYLNLNKDDNNIINNVDCLLFKNLSFYINQDIDFYEYYKNSKKDENLLLNQSKQNLENNEETSFRINEDSFSDENENNQETLEENIMKGLNSNFMKNLLSSREKPKKIENQKSINIKSKTEKEKENDIIIKDIFANDKYIKEGYDNIDDCINIDYNINFDYEENISKNKKEINDEENENNIELLFMKNLHHKLLNYEKNKNIENILLFNLMITIITIPNFSFDNDLLKFNLVLLDNDEKSKYSFLTIFKYNSNILLDKLKYAENEINLKLQLKEFGLIESNSENKKYKIGLDFQGFKCEENMTQKEKEKNKIINWIIFCEFIKEFISCISQKYKFEELIEHLFSFYSEQLDEFYNDNINDEEDNENENIENKDDEADKFF